MKHLIPNSTSFETELPPTHLTGPIMNRQLRITGLLIMFAVFLTWSSPASAVTIVDSIDGFGDAQYEFASGANNSNASGTVVVSAGLVAPSGRSVYVEKTAGSNNVNLRVEALDDDIDTAFSVSRASNIQGNVLLQWDGDTTDAGAPAAFNPLSNLSFLLGGGAGIDLTNGNALGILVRILAADLAGQQLRITLFGADATVASEQLVNLPTVVPPGSFDALFPFLGDGNNDGFNDGFTLRAGAASTPNPNAIRAFTMSITGPTGSDLTIDLLGTYVPEPATASMFGFATLAVMARLRRRKPRSA